MNLFQIVFVPLCTLAAINQLLRLRRGQTSWLAGLFWFFVWAAGAVAIAYPPITSLAAKVFGITRGSDLVLYLVTLGLLVFLRVFYNRYRRLENMVTQLAREMALNQAQVHGHPCSDMRS
ncbi:DUF2304 domain-containing protein [Thermogutta sp.]|jgi:hypothetical protein|uniref:DUF2304 domain-containing protein n=1 Tax=Thermogutta sp. TaxID=1962930 RepID=UPI00321FD8CE